MREVSCKVETDKFTDAISKAFDYEFTGISSFTIPEFECPKKFNIGIIVGSSGSGKSLILEEVFGLPEIPKWNRRKAIISHFETPDEAIEKLFAVGIASIPTMCRPYHVLSTGEAYRAEMARILDNKAIIDEFTSTVNRETAKSLSVAISKYIRKKNLNNIVFASCHKDILEWLEPDWVFDTDIASFDYNEFSRNDLKRVGYYVIE